MPSQVRSQTNSLLLPQRKRSRRNRKVHLYECLCSLCSLKTCGTSGLLLCIICTVFQTVLVITYSTAELLAECTGLYCAMDYILCHASNICCHITHSVTVSDAVICQSGWFSHGPRDWLILGNPSVFVSKVLCQTHLGLLWISNRSNPHKTRCIAYCWIR